MATQTTTPSFLDQINTMIADAQKTVVNGVQSYKNMVTAIQGPRQVQPSAPPEQRTVSVMQTPSKTPFGLPLPVLLIAGLVAYKLAK